MGEINMVFTILCAAKRAHHKSVIEGECGIFIFTVGNLKHCQEVTQLVKLYTFA